MTFDTLGSWNSRLKIKVEDSEVSLESVVTSEPRIAMSSVGVKSLVGRRDGNEDRIIAKQIKSNLLLFGIFDGHGGNMAVDHVVEELPKLVMYCLDSGERELEQVLRKAFFEVNSSFTKLYETMTNGSDSKGKLSSGTTATVCLVRDGTELTIAHVGDSRSIMSRDNTLLRLTVDHLPSVKTEAERIVRCKGHLTWSSLGRSRVNGRLEMTRSIGDVELKRFGVTAEPDVINLKINHATDSFLALVTDGVHSRLTSAEMVQLIACSSDPREAVESLTDTALLSGSEDNCSALVIPLGAWGKYSRAKGSRRVHFGSSSIRWH